MTLRSALATGNGIIKTILIQIMLILLKSFLFDKGFPFFFLHCLQLLLEYLVASVVILSTEHLHKFYFNV